MFRFRLLAAIALLVVSIELHGASVPVVVQSNLTVKVMAANLTSGTSQRYEAPGIRIFQGLKPDIVAIQEFLYAGSIRSLVDTAFGADFYYYQEPNTLPNGIVSRWPILSSGTFVQPGMSNRGFAWARIDVPGTNDLYVVSVHLKASSSDAARRAEEALSLVNSVKANFPANAWVVVAGDFNLDSTNEAAYATMKASFSDRPTPADQAGDPDTNASRLERYDYVFSSWTLTNALVPTIIGTRTHTGGLVFDSRKYSPLSEVSPVQQTDSGVTGMQHMGVLRSYQISFAVTNYVDLPVITVTGNILTWQAPAGRTSRVQGATNISAPTWKDMATYTTTNPRYTNRYTGKQVYYRVVLP